MSMQRPKLIAVLLGVATAFAAETTYAQATRSDPTAPATRAPSSTAPSASKGMNDNRASPAGKAAWLEEHNADDALMLGDGANDSLAFDRALCRGTPVGDSVPDREAHGKRRDECRRGRQCPAPR